jgi:hypothetical protein
MRLLISLTSSRPGSYGHWRCSPIWPGSTEIIVGAFLLRCVTAWVQTIKAFD